MLSISRFRPILDFGRPQDVVVADGTVEAQRARVLAAVKTRRSAPPPRRGAEGLDGSSAHARPDGLLHDGASDPAPLHVVVDDLSRFRQFLAPVDSWTDHGRQHPLRVHRGRRRNGQRSGWLADVEKQAEEPSAVIEKRSEVQMAELKTDLKADIQTLVDHVEPNHADLRPPNGWPSNITGARG